MCCCVICCEGKQFRMTRREALIALNLLPEVGPCRLRSLMQYFSEPQEILGASVERLRRVPRLGEKCISVLHSWEENCDLPGEERYAQLAGVSIVTFEDPSYPRQLLDIHDPPICLYVRGDIQALSRSFDSLAMVGSRFVTSYGVTMAKQLASQVAMAGWIVVSGLARGIDTVCHTSALDVGGCTIAVLGCGLDRIYPPENLELARRIASSGGALLSEFSLGTRPAKGNFPMRNRIISGLSRGTLVVEAGLNSGSLITAAQSLEQGRAVFAVPGRAGDVTSSGCNALLRDGARLVERYEDIREEFSVLPSLRESVLRREEKIRDARSVSEEVPLKPLEFRIWSAIGDSERQIDEIVEELGEPVSSVLGALLTLEIRQMVRQLPGKLVNRVPGRRGVLLQ